MPFVYPTAQIGDRLLFTFKGKLFNQTIMNTFWYRINDLVGAPKLDEVADEAVAKIVGGVGLLADFLAVTPPQYTLEEIWAQPIDPVRYAKLVYPQAVTGTWAEDAFTANTAAVIERRGVTAARNAVGSLHVAIAAGTASLASGNLTAGLKAAMGTLATKMEAQLVTATLYKLDLVLRHGVGGANYTLVGKCFVQNTARVMRRRTVGLGI